MRCSSPCPLVKKPAITAPDDVHAGPHRRMAGPERNDVERFFNQLKQLRRIGTRCDKLGANFMAFIQLAAVRISARIN